VRKPLLVVAVSLAVIGLAGSASAQTLTFSLFERYLEPLRQQWGIPGLSVAIVRGDGIVWERGFGLKDVDTGVPATPDTPYLLGDLAQVLGSTVLLKTCVDEGYLELGDRVTRWVPEYPDPLATVEDLLSHTTTAGSFQYDPVRSAALTGVVEECVDQPYPQVLAREIFDRFGMGGSVPATSVGALTSTAPPLFLSATLDRYDNVLRQAAPPYRIDRGRAFRSDVPSRLATTAGDVVASVRDLARFDAALRTGALLSEATLTRAWTQSRAHGTVVPAGLGWFVQNYQGEPVIWQFGQVKDGASSLLVHLPRRDLTLILLANSDGLSSPFALGTGDITVSAFARLFLRLFIV
jgi:CubicO group peptidase (beta-lactamase class C family)